MREEGRTSGLFWDRLTPAEQLELIKEGRAEDDREDEKARAEADSANLESIREQNAEILRRLKKP
ncbi:MAG: hypothetical protein AAB152_16780 [Candidatus Coatesbacteria bacterium]